FRDFFGLGVAVRLYRLMVRYEMGDTDELAREMQATERYIRKKESLHRSLVLDHLTELLRIKSIRAETAQWQSVYAALQAADAATFEFQLRELPHFIAWARRHVDGCVYEASVGELARQRTRQSPLNTP
ncbi:MAG: hypothetical protein AAF570_21680, partial [Bacteroidota bacterium]